jgi:homeobox-leucine zipper protein
VKACGDENKGIRQELAKLKAENEELKQRTLNPICFRCSNPTVAIQSVSENWRQLNENARLRDEYVRAKAYMDRLIREAAAERPPSAMPSSAQHLAPAHMNMDPVAFTSDCSMATNLEATLISHADRAMKEFVMLATKGEPMWVPAMDGEMLNHQEYIMQTFPGLLGLCPQGFVTEATRETDMIKGTAMDLVSVLTDVVTLTHTSLQLHI